MDVIGIEKLRQQMLEEAMAQLTANQEKIAASEGKGPSWEDKVIALNTKQYYPLNNIINYLQTYIGKHI